MSDADVIDTWERVAGAPALLDVASGVAAHVDPAGIGRVRKAAAVLGGDSASLARTAIELVRARKKLIAKWGDEGERAIADVAGAEMASSDGAARHKARRFERCARVLDLCCGIGGDLRALPQGDGVELDPVRAWMGERNSGRPVRVGDVEALGCELDGSWAHIDPVRREGSGPRRANDALARMTPGLEFVESCVERCAGLAVKLAPGVDAEDLPDGELEIISERGRLTQGVLWTGDLGETGLMRATRLAGVGARTITASRDRAGELMRTAVVGDGVVRAGAVVCVSDPAVERAGLLGVLAEATGTGVVHPLAGMLAGAPSGGAGGWCSAYRVLERLTWSRSKVGAAVRAHAGGSGEPVVVKVRGKVVDPDAEQRALRPTGDGARDGGPLTVFVQRLAGSGSTVEALVCERVGSGVEVVDPVSDEVGEV